MSRQSLLTLALIVVLSGVTVGVLKAENGSGLPPGGRKVLVDVGGEKREIIVYGNTAPPRPDVGPAPAMQPPLWVKYFTFPPELTLESRTGPDHTAVVTGTSSLTAEQVVAALEKAMDVYWKPSPLKSGTEEGIDVIFTNGSPTEFVLKVEPATGAPTRWTMTARWWRAN